ncbi:aspartate kinase [bacterium]|nr:aspartate kinase [bacterium]
MALIVQKYGGSSLANPRLIRGAAARIAEVRNQGKELVVVVSAMGRMTDMLVRLAHKTVKAPSDREMDMLLSAGERVSMSLLAMALHELGVPAISFTGSQSGIVTTGEHTNARIIDIKANRIREELARGKVVIIAGFQGVSETKEVTTLGRGGSDTTAVALAAELGAECCEILTDVEGILTADPRIVPNARLISECSYDEALELASRGAKLHSRSVEVAKRFQVPVKVAPSRDASATGTHIHSAAAKNVERALVRGVATRDGLAFFRVRSGIGHARRVLQEQQVIPRHFQMEAGECSWLIDEASAARLREGLFNAGVAFEENPKACLVSLVGESLTDAREVLSGFLETIEGSGAHVIAMASNSLSLCVAVDASHKPTLARDLHKRFLEV